MNNHDMQIISCHSQCAVCMKTTTLYASWGRINHQCSKAHVLASSAEDEQTIRTARLCVCMYMLTHVCTQYDDYNDICGLT